MTGLLAAWSSYAKLSSGVAVIKVGATTEVELKEEASHRGCGPVDQSAVEEGIVPGGLSRF